MDDDLLEKDQNQTQPDRAQFVQEKKQTVDETLLADFWTLGEDLFYSRYDTYEEYKADYLQNTAGTYWDDFEGDVILYTIDDYEEALAQYILVDMQKAFTEEELESYDITVAVGQNHEMVMTLFDQEGYQKSVNQFSQRNERDAFRKKLDEKVAVKSQTLYYFDGKQEIAVAADLCSVEDFQDDVILFTTYPANASQKVKMSDLWNYNATTVFDTYYNMLSEEQPQSAVAYGGTASTYSVENAQKQWLATDATAIYVIAADEQVVSDAGMDINFFDELLPEETASTSMPASNDNDIMVFSTSSQVIYSVQENGSDVYLVVPSYPELSEADFTDMSLVLMEMGIDLADVKMKVVADPTKSIWEDTSAEVQEGVGSAAEEEQAEPAPEQEPSQKIIKIPLKNGVPAEPIVLREKAATLGVKEGSPDIILERADEESSQYDLYEGETLLDSDVYPSMGGIQTMGNGTYVYAANRNEDGTAELRICQGKKPETIAQDVKSFIVSENTVYYVDESGDLYAYSGKKTMIDNDVSATLYSGSRLPFAISNTAYRNIMAGVLGQLEFGDVGIDELMKEAYLLNGGNASTTVNFDIVIEDATEAAKVE